MLGAIGSDRLRAHRSHAQCDHADRAAKCHAAEDVSFSGIVGCAMLLQVLFDDLSLLSRVVDRGRCHADTDDRDTQCQGDGETGNSGGCGRSRDQARIVLPFSLELFGGHAIAFRVVGLEVERHLESGGTGDSVDAKEEGT